MATFGAIFDACVLYPFSVRDVLLELSTTSLFRGRWSEDILGELFVALGKARPDVSAEKWRDLRMLMNENVRDAIVSDYESILSGLTLPDENDRHVLAAAIKGRLDVIVTYNLKDFPAEILMPYGIEAQHPDEFLTHLFDLDSGRVCHAIKRCRARLKMPPLGVDEYLLGLEKRELVEFVSCLRTFSDNL